MQELRPQVLQADEALPTQLGIRESFAPSLWEPSEPDSLPRCFLPRARRVRLDMKLALVNVDWLKSANDAFQYMPNFMFSVGVETIFPHIYMNMGRRLTDPDILKATGIDTAKDWKEWDARIFRKFIDYVSRPQIHSSLRPNCPQFMT